MAESYFLGFSLGGVLAPRFINIVIRSMGKGKIRVLFLSEAISVSVCR